MSRTHLADTRKIEKYQLLGPLDKGGMGRVFDGRIDFPVYQRRPCAIKFMRDDRRDVRYVALFLREAMIGLEVSGHPNIVTTRDFVQRSDGRLFIVLDKEGPALDRCFEELQGRHARIRTIAEGILCALRHLRHKRVVHGDISLANILLSRDGVAKLNDFGLARREGEIPVDRFDSPGYGFLGTLEYASPETANDARPDHRSDLFSLGAVLYELLTGRLANRDPRTWPENAPGDLIELITGLLHPNPADRLSVESALEILHHSDHPGATREEIAQVANEWIAVEQAERGQPVRVETRVKALDAAAAYLRQWPSNMRRQGSWDVTANASGDPAASNANSQDAPTDGDRPPLLPGANDRRSIAFPSSSLWIVAVAMATIALVLAVHGALQRPESPAPAAHVVTTTAAETEAARSADEISEDSGDAKEQPNVTTTDDLEIADVEESSAAATIEIKTSVSDSSRPTREYRAPKRSKRKRPAIRTGRVRRDHKFGS